MDRNDLQRQIQNAQGLGQKLEDLVVNAGKMTIKTEASHLLIGLWSPRRAFGQLFTTSAALMFSLIVYRQR
jgi:hypothetical protein